MDSSSAAAIVRWTREVAVWQRNIDAWLGTLAAMASVVGDDIQIADEARQQADWTPRRAATLLIG